MIFERPDLGVAMVLIVFLVIAIWLGHITVTRRGGPE